MEITQMAMYVMLFFSLYFEVFLLITFFERSEYTPETKTHASPDIASKHAPRVAIIVPCFNEEATVGGTLRSLLALAYPAEKLEIIAVNDGSRDNTRHVLESFAPYPQITVIHKENGGKHSAMNAALAATDAELIGCLDADSFVEPDALTHVVRHFRNPQIAAVTPSIKVFQARGIIQFIQKAEYGLSIFVRNTLARLDSLFITPGPFSFFRRAVVDEVGPWRYAHSTEDMEMCMRLQKHRYKIANEPRAIVHTTAPRTLYQLFKQRVRWTYGFVKNAIDYSFMFFNPRYNTLGLLVLPVSALSLVMGIIIFGILLWEISVLIVRELIRFQTVGLNPSIPQFDLFFFNTSALLTITISLLTLTVVLMGLGKRLARDTFFSFDVPVYLALYGFITPLWLTAAVYKSVVRSGVRWR